ncbi:MAG: SpoIIE family protein phosphatase [Phycisphaerales bacterium]|nr:SpoIIE family protein phosphatase [Phycisphaerales bacterium]
MTTASFETTEFRRTFRQETDDLLRTRLIWFISIWGGLGFVLTTIMIIMLVQGVDLSKIMQNGGQKAFFILTTIIWFGAYLGSLLLVLSKRVESQTIIRITMGLVMLDGVQGIGTRVMDMASGPSLAGFVLAHFIACCLFPWTVKQAIIPVISILAASMFSAIVIESHSVVPTIITTLVYAAFMTPGVFITGVKHSQRVQKATNKFLNQRYGMLRQELAYARQVHEALFPAPIASGELCYSYRYEPMRQIGGDYLYTKQSEDRTKLSVVIVDVTGHGIPAALTVNRLHGEIDIAFAEDPDITPGQMLERLNRYVHLTLAKHSIYATAVCIRVNHDTGKVEYASGGHPPAFIRGIDGSLNDLDPTTFVLGACSEQDFESGQIEIDFAPGDSLIAYTDGAIEARSLEGKMFQIDGLRRLLASPAMPGVSNAGQGQWAEKILEEVAAFRGGLPPEDDTLAIEIYRPISPNTSSIGVRQERVTEAEPVQIS